MKVKAFTLIELIIVMFLTALLILLAGGIFYYLTQYKTQLNRKAVPVNEIARFQYLLDLDAYRFEHIKMAGDTLKFEGEGVVSYVPLDTILVRSQAAMMDTFALKVEIQQLKLQEGVVESCVIRYSDDQNHTGSLYLKKEYSTHQLLNFESEDESE